jgi:hypothetical protein
MKYKDNVAMCLLHWAIKYVRLRKIELFLHGHAVVGCVFAGCDLQNGVLSVRPARRVGELPRGSETHDFHSVSARKIRKRARLLRPVFGACALHRETELRLWLIMLPATLSSQDLFGHGIFNSNGERWHQQREFAKGLFLPESLKNTMTIFEKYAHQLAGHLDAKGLHNNVDMQDFFMRYTLTSFGEAGFGAELGAIGEDVNQFALAFDYLQTERYLVLSRCPVLACSLC